MEHPGAGLTRPALQAGGALRETSIYIERRADGELVEALLRGEQSAVIAPRQMGKSSLRRRAERRLSALGVRCLSVDLAAIGSAGVTEAPWYYALCLFLAERGGASIDLPRFWDEQEDLAPAERWSRFLREGLATQERARVIVFIDELDVALGLSFPLDEFLASLAPIEHRSPLAFCLLGVTEPERWTRSPARAPGAALRVIRPGPFTREEAAALLPALGAAGGDPEALLSAVLRWTGGHPYLTLRLCELLVQAGPDPRGSAEERVARAVNDGIAEEPAFTALRARVSPA